MSYWEDRLIREQEAISDKNIKQLEAELRKIYRKASENVIDEFVTTYERIVATVFEEGRDPTPADLYALDRYWQMQAQLDKELRKLGDKSIKAMTKQFVDQWQSVYKRIALPLHPTFATISTSSAEALIKNAWLRDGLNYSQRVWNNTGKLAETLNEELTNCVVTGKRTRELKNLLQERFNVSYSRAETLVRTEISHIQTSAAAQRYIDAGLRRYKFIGREKDREGCGHEPNCYDLDGKTFSFTEMMPGENAPPMHPRCRCCIAPVLNDF